MIKKIILSLLLCQICTYLKAQEESTIQMDRPDQTETPYTVPLHYLQFESGFTYEKVNSNAISFQLPTLLTKYGISKHTELRLITELNYNKSSVEKKIRFQPITIGFKTALIEEKGIIPKISFIGHLGLFSRNENLQKRVIPSFKFELENTLSENFTLGYNLGMEWDNNLKENYVYTFTVARSITSKIDAYLEVYGTISPMFTADNRIDGGIAYLITNDSAVDISAGKGLSKLSTDWYVSLGYSIRFNLKK